MFYKQQGGGPWGSDGGNGRGGGNPWGSRGQGGAGAPDFEEMFRKGQERFRGMLPGGGSSRTLWGIAAIILFLWGMSGFYRVQPEQQGVELLFGEYIKTTQPGLNYWFPAPFGDVMKPKVTQTNQITVGFRGAGVTYRDVPQESLVLTGDQNIVDVKFVVQWRIGDAGAFLFNMRDPEGTTKIAAESSLREVIGQNPLQSVLTNERVVIAQQSEELLQSIMDSYNSGVTILDLRIQSADPPSEVIDAFNEVQRASQDEERLRNEALAYRNDIVPRAKGEAARMVQSATAQKEKLIKEAEGQAARFEAFYKTYAADKSLTASRMYLETMEEILSVADKVLLDSDGKGSGVVPYLPLPEIRKRSRKSEDDQ